MTHFRRFGRRFNVPSTLQIAHELRAFPAAQDASGSSALDASSPGPGVDIVALRSPLENTFGKGAST